MIYAVRLYLIFQSKKFVQCHFHMVNYKVSIFAHLSEIFLHLLSSSLMMQLHQESVEAYLIKLWYRLCHFLFLFFNIKLVIKTFLYKLLIYKKNTHVLAIIWWAVIYVRLNNVFHFSPAVSYTCIEITKI